MVVFSFEFFLRYLREPRRIWNAVRITNSYLAGVTWTRGDAPQSLLPVTTRTLGAITSSCGTDAQINVKAGSRAFGEPSVKAKKVEVVAALPYCCGFKEGDRAPPCSAARGRNLRVRRSPVTEAWRWGDDRRRRHLFRVSCVDSTVPSLESPPPFPPPAEVVAHWKFCDVLDPGGRVVISQAVVCCWSWLLFITVRLLFASLFSSVLLCSI